MSRFVFIALDPILVSMRRFFPVFAFLVSLFVLGCVSPGAAGPGAPAPDALDAVAAVGDAVAILFTAKADGLVFDTNIREVAEHVSLNLTRFEALRFVVGSDEVMPGIDEAVRGMRVNQTRTLTLSPDKMFGKWDSEKVIRVPHSYLNYSARVGMLIFENQELVGRVTNVTNQLVTIDANSLLAGKPVEYTLTLVGLEKA